MIRALLLLAIVAGLLAPTAAWADATLDHLVAQARAEAPAEVQLHLIKTYERMSGFTATVRSAGPVPGWPQIRATGDAAFAAWDQHKRDYTWRSERFEVLWDVVDGRELRLNSVTFGGIERRAER